MKLVDKSNMRQVILDFPKQFRLGLESTEKVLKPYSYKAIKLNNVVVCGMGGSALAADLLMDFLRAEIKVQKKFLPVFVHKNYGLPVIVGKNSLTICSSYSGNTEEAIDFYKEALKRKLNVVAITIGGQLAKLARKNKKPLVLLPDLNIQPRSAIGLQFAALSCLLYKYGIMKNISADLLKLEKILKPKNLEKPGKGLAKKLLNKIPIIYTSAKWQSLVYNWKIRFNEIGKSHAFGNVFPELNHNEIVAYATDNRQEIPSDNRNFFVIILRDKDDHPRILKRMKLTAEIIKKSGNKVEFVDIEGKNVLGKMFSTLILGDWTAYYLAVERGIDPTPVKIIEDFKKEMK